MSDEHHMIACGQHAEARRVAEARIAALEAQVARLTAEPDQAEIEAAWDALDLPDVPDEFDIRAALTAFLERRMKG